LVKEIKPDHRLLVIQADIGQTAKAQAAEFQKSVDVNGVIVDSDTVTDTTLTFNNVMRGYVSGATNFDLYGKMEYFTVIDENDDVILNIRSMNEKLVDTTGTYKITETGAEGDKKEIQKNQEFVKNVTR